MATRKRRTFTAQFKTDAVALVTRGGKSVAAAAKQLGISDGNLRIWLKQAPTTSAPDNLTFAERAELMELRKKLKRVEMERDLLKKATAYFARENA
jgi:transposase-like protein